MHEEPGFFAEPRNWVLIAFILFFVIFGKKLWAPLAKMLDDRGTRVAPSWMRRRDCARKLRQCCARPRQGALRRCARLRRDRWGQDRSRTGGGRGSRRSRGFGTAARADGDGPIAAAEGGVDEVRLTAAEVATVAARQVIAEGLSAEADARSIDDAISRCRGCGIRRIA